MNDLRRCAWTLLAFAAAAAVGCRSGSSDATRPSTARAGDVVAGGTAGATSPEPVRPASRVVKLEGIRVRVDESIVELDARTCLDVGWLEQIACSPGSREHEALVVVPARPSDIHAALLMAGFEPGRPGHWTYEDGRYAFVAPVGERLEVLVRYETPAGDPLTEPISRWIRDYGDHESFPEAPWVFGGSSMAENTPDMGPGEHYVADMTGSVIGLVTFGDEVIGFSRVIADESAVMAPQWVVDTDRVPAMGTDVTIVIRRAAASGTATAGAGASGDELAPPR